MKKLLLLVLLMGCGTHNASIAMLPDPPVHPALENPELMSESDRVKLAHFYRQYEVFLKKYRAYKKTFGG